MANPKTGEAKAAFLKTFRATAKYKHRYDVFRDFVTMTACSLHNAVWMDDDREQEYLKIIGSYEREDQRRFPELMAQLVTILEEDPRDVLGSLYMELEIANKDTGQFFTPDAVSYAMTKITLGELDHMLGENAFVTISEPACGAGGMVLSAVKYMTERGCDPAKVMWVQAIDIDRLAALMCYVQLSLWNVPGEVIVGDTLRWQHREVWYTPAHILGNWKQKLKDRTPVNMTDDEPEVEAPEADPPAQPEEPPEPAGAEPEAQSKSPSIYDEETLTWKGQDLTVRWCPNWCEDVGMGHLEIISPDRTPHPISETGYKSHFIHAVEVDEAGGPVAYTTAWLESKDDGKAVQLSLF